MLLLATSLAVDRLAASHRDEFQELPEHRLHRFYETNHELQLRDRIAELRLLTNPSIEDWQRFERNAATNCLVSIRAD